MRGRPVTEEEFREMVRAVPKVRPENARPWQRLLVGLWLSGLRISEAAILSWEWHAPLSVNLESACFHIGAEAQKSHKDELLPITPDFVRFLEKVRPERRHGLVFEMNVSADCLVRGISDIGKAAGVVVSERGKHASAHDLRRSFGTRWATRVAPAVLQKLMRHSDINTTMTYYVKLDAESIARELKGTW
jgi:integrase